MSNICSLCGNIRSDGSLFCSSCTKKMQTDYEVELPEDVVDDSEVVNSELVNSEAVSNEEINSESISSESINNDLVEEDFTLDNEELNKNKNNKQLSNFLKITISALIVVVLLFVYNKTVREDNLERSAWESALKVNSVEGYLNYIESHASGVHFDDAHAGLMRLKQDEAAIWEQLKESDNISELTGFINKFNNSPYLPLANIRLDSLSWIAALKVNTAQSYFEYLQNSRSGYLIGDYSAEAERRYGWLFQSVPVNIEVLDSINATVGGFFSSLTSIDHDGMYRFLAPHVQRFFDSGGASRTRIAGELLVTAAQIGGSKVSFSPNIEDVKYQILPNGGYEVNVPFVKSYSEGGSNVLVPGYIAHISINREFEIYSIYETKPYSGAP